MATPDSAPAEAMRIRTWNKDESLFPQSDQLHSRLKALPVPHLHVATAGTESGVDMSPRASDLKDYSPCFTDRHYSSRLRLQC